MFMTKLHLPSTSRSSRQASKAAVSTWTELKKRPDVSTPKLARLLKHSDSGIFQVPRYVPGISQTQSASTGTGSRQLGFFGDFLSSVHVDTAALLACLEDRLVLGRCSFVINTGNALSHSNNQK